MAVPQFSHRIYGKPMSLPEFILERARSSAGDTRRLHEMFQRLESGMQCSSCRLLSSLPVLMCTPQHDAAQDEAHSDQHCALL